MVAWRVGRRGRGGAAAHVRAGGGRGALRMCAQAAVGGVEVGVLVDDGVTRALVEVIVQDDAWVGGRS